MQAKSLGKGAMCGEILENVIILMMIAFAQQRARHIRDAMDRDSPIRRLAARPQGITN